MGPVVCLELIDHIFDVKTHSRFGDSEVSGNLFIAQPNANKPKNIQFTSRQALMPHVFRQSGRNIRRNASSTAVHLANDIEQLVLRNTFEHVSQSTCS